MFKMFKWRLGNYLLILDVGRLLFNFWLLRPVKYNKSKLVMEKLKNGGLNVIRIKGVPFINGKMHCVLHLYFQYGKINNSWAKGLSVGFAYNQDIKEMEEVKGWYRNFFVKSILEKGF